MNSEPKYYYPRSQIKQNQPTKQDINKKYKQIADQFINSQHPDLKRSINKQIQDYTTESNDNTKVNNVQHRQYNQHLKQRTIAGAKSNALWEKEHPTLSTLGYTAAAAPFVVASAPALIPAGDALAGSAVGNGISSILTNPYFNAVITASGGADAANKIYHGEYSKSPIQDAFTAMEVIPLASQTLRFSNGYNPISSYIKGNYRFLKDHGLSKAAEDIDMERYVPQKLQQSVNTQVGKTLQQLKQQDIELPYKDTKVYWRNTPYYSSYADRNTGNIYMGFSQSQLQNPIKFIKSYNADSNNLKLFNYKLIAGHEPAHLGQSTAIYRNENDAPRLMPWIKQSGKYRKPVNQYIQGKGDNYYSEPWKEYINQGKFQDLNKTRDVTAPGIPNTVYHQNHLKDPGELDADLYALKNIGYIKDGKISDEAAKWLQIRHNLSPEGLKNSLKDLDAVGYAQPLSSPKTEVFKSGVDWSSEMQDKSLINVINQNIHKRLRDYRLGRIIKDASLKFDGTVGESYFKSPDKWYRTTEYPEVQGIREVGQNVTTSDAMDQAFDVPANNWRMRAMNIKDYNDNLTKSHNFSLRKMGSAHGNTSQASKGIPWQGTISDSRGQFPSGILEGQARQQEFMGLNRTTFVPTNWEEIPHGERLGFHTGEMPLDNLTFFKKLPNGRYSFEPVIPNKIGFYNPIKEVYPTTSLKFYENSQKISDAEKLGIPK